MAGKFNKGETAIPGDAPGAAVLAMKSMADERGAP
jgi:hypothetical protein